jgi:lipid-A-disaccharide synthase
MKKIFLISGEESGDIHAANMIRQLKKLTDFSLYGTGGSRLKELGQIQFFDINQMTIIGINEVIQKLPFILKMFRTLKERLLEIKPDLVVLVDYPGFNLKFADFAKRNGFRVVYYIAPQVWAWHYSRVYKMRSTIDHLYCILPFEEDLFRKEGINATYVGNPIIDNIRFNFIDSVQFFNNYGLDLNKKTIGLLPGSRKKEVENILPVFLEALNLLNKSYNFILAQADSITSELLHGIPDYVRVIKGDTYDVMRYSDVLWCCSGTATLESAFVGTPPIILYKVPYFTEFIGRYILKLKRIGLPNIVLGKDIFPELINKELNSQNILKWTKFTLSNKEYFEEYLRYIYQLLANKNPSLNTAEHIFNNFL